MSQVHPFLSSYNPKDVALVKKVIEKTKQHKIKWSKFTRGLKATTKDLEMSFVMSLVPVLAPLLGRSTWALFTIRGPSGNEILKIEGPISAFDIFSKSPVTEAVDELLMIVTVQEREEVDRAIDLLDQI